MRKVKIVTTLGVAGEFSTNITTFGELKVLLRERNIDISNMNVIVGETLNSLTHDDAVLPTTDFKLFISPAKTKAGSDFESHVYFNHIDEIKDKINDFYINLSVLKSDLYLLKSKTVKYFVADSEINTKISSAIYDTEQIESSLTDLHNLMEELIDSYEEIDDTPLRDDFTSNANTMDADVLTARKLFFGE